MKPASARHFCRLITLCLIFGGACARRPSSDQPNGRAGSGAKEAAAQPSRDHLLGWYELPGRGHGGTFIPVFKHEGTYYTTSFPGVEVPLRPSPRGLEWAATPSSMTSTTLIYDPQSTHPYSLAIHDDNAVHQTSGSWGGGEQHPLRKVAKPAWLPNAKARRPRALDDFVGWYQYAWCPILAMEVKKEGAKYLAASFYTDKPGEWKPADKPIELQPWPDGEGFTMGPRGLNQQRDKTQQLIYNNARKRFEMTLGEAKRSPEVLRIPLACIPSPFSPEFKKHPMPPKGARVGIPTWR